ncbi:MAG TPA: hypothetical protein VK013_17635 [Myxococcaceae bacterium]|nr:hypothetical protein [Myxococcaceae bacterium]
MTGAVAPGSPLNVVVGFAGYRAEEIDVTPGLTLAHGPLDLQPVDTFSFSPSYDVPEGLTFSRMCS